VGTSSTSTGAWLPSQTWPASAPSATDGSASHERQVLWRSLAVWVIGLALSVSFGLLMANDHREAAMVQFDREAVTLERDVRARLDAILPALKGVRSTFVAAPQAMHRSTFKTWVEHRDVDVDAAGIRGLGLIERVPRNHLDAFVARERADDAPQFAVRTKGHADDLYVIRLIEPIAHNGPALGFDVGSEPTRRAAAELAIATGQDTLTGRITLVQDGQRRSGCLYYLPIFKPGAPVNTPAERMNALVGLAYSPVVYEELLATAVRPHAARLQVQLLQAEAAGDRTLLFAHGPDVERTDAAFRKHFLLNVGQRELLLQVSSTPAFEQQLASRSPWWFGLIGALLATAASFALWLLGVGRVRAQRMVTLRTRDLVEAKATAELALAERAELSERLALAIDGANDGLWDWVNVREDHIWWSPQFYRLLGMAPSTIEVTPKSLIELLHPDDRTRTRATMLETLTRQAPFDIEYRLRTASGEYRWFHARAKVYRNEDGTVHRMAGTIQDVHEQRLMKSALADSLAQVQGIFALSTDAFVSLNELGRVSYINPAFEQLTGIPLALARDCHEVDLMTLLRQHAFVQPHVRTFEDLPAHLDRRPPAKLTLAIQWHHGHGAVAKMLHLRDITRVTELDRIKSSFISIAAHELRTPMSSIYGFTELLLNHDFAPAKQKDLLSRIWRQSSHMIDIINELLDISRMEARQGQDMDPQALHLPALVARVLTDHAVPSGRTPPHTYLDEAAQTVWADEAATIQVLTNVLANAYKYSPDGGDVLLSVRPNRHDPRLVDVVVQDHGIGMSPEQLARVGERFYRADTSGRIPGTGLGMSIVMGTMKLMGGSVSIDSKLGHGTSVTLSFPNAPTH